jgi:hypothetical protein
MRCKYDCSAISRHCMALQGCGGMCKHTATVHLPHKTAHLTPALFVLCLTADMQDPGHISYSLSNALYLLAPVCLSRIQYQPSTRQPPAPATSQHCKPAQTQRIKPALQRANCWHPHRQQTKPSQANAAEQVAMGIKDTAMFRKFARKAFDEIDMDKTGRVDYKEVRCQPCACYVYAVRLLLGCHVVWTIPRCGAVHCNCHSTVPRQMHAFTCFSHLLVGFQVCY